MNRVALYFASGDSLYLGAFFLAVGVLVSLLLGRRLLYLQRTVTWLGVAFVIIASSPSPRALDIGLGASFLLWYVASTLAADQRAVRFVASGFFLTFLIWFSAQEFLHSRLPVVQGGGSDHLVVIGDSISSGIGSPQKAWPAIFQAMTGVPVKNLARPGAGVFDARLMAAQVTAEDHVVLIEIGGNDLLAGISPAEFGHSLETVLSFLSRSGRTLVMFELPLLPNMVRYGQIQRQLSAKYAVRLIPRRYFAAVLSGASATTDGLHLSEVGAQRMTALVYQVLGGVLKPNR